jgi:ribosomal protein S18/ribosomal protein S6
MNIPGGTMIYETAFVVKADASEDSVNAIKTLVTDTLKQYEAEVLVNDAWGVKTFAQAYESGAKKGNFFYVMYKGKGTVNAELERKFGINEDLLRFTIVRLGEDRDQDKIVKGYKNPNHVTQTAGTGEDGEMMEEGDKEKRMHSKRKSCYFSAKKTSPDWKDPKSYSWLVNEFGKISPARVTGLTPRFQRLACDAIKRGRAMGLISYTSSETFR